MSRFCLALFSSAALLAPVFPGHADGQDPQKSAHLNVIYDQTVAVRLDDEAKTIIVGNPSIAEAVLVNEKTIYVQGRTFGNTNLVALDSNGTEILNTTVSVGAPNLAQVTLYRGALGQRNLACSPRCETTVTPGDAELPKYSTDANSKIDVSKKGAEISSPH